jgi:hypothetical protein
MTLTPGTRLGPYRVLDKLGALRLGSGQAGPSTPHEVAA